MSGNGSIPDEMKEPVSRLEFEALKSRVIVAEGQVDSIDGGEQDLRAQLRSLRIKTFRQVRVTKDANGEDQVEFVHALSEDPSLEARMTRIEDLLTSRVPAPWVQKSTVTLVVTIVMAILAKQLGIPVPEIAP